MTVEYGYLGSLDVTSTQAVPNGVSRVPVVNSEGEPTYVPAAENRWAGELMASDGKWRFLKGTGGTASVSTVFNSILANTYTLLCLHRNRPSVTNVNFFGKSDGVNGLVLGTRPKSDAEGDYVRIHIASTFQGRKANPAVHDCNWHWMGASFDSSATSYMSYFDGKGTSTSKTAGATSNTAAFTALAGGIDLAVGLVFNRVLTDTEVSNICMGKTLPKEVSGLVGYYKFNETHGTAAGECTDYSGQGNHLTYTAAVWEQYATDGNQNLLVQSQDFDSASWAKIRVSAFGSGSVANATTAPDGSATADYLAEDSTAAQSHYIRQNYAKPAIAQQHTFSVYMKAATRSWVRLMVANAALSAYSSVYVNIATGALGAAGCVNTGAFAGSSAVVTDEGDGWYRVAFTATADTDTTLSSYVWVTSGDNISSNDGLGAAYGIYIWGAQLERGSVASTYLPTFATNQVSNVQSGQPYVARTKRNEANWWERMPPAIADPERMGCHNGGTAIAVTYNALMNITGDLSYGGWIRPNKYRSGDTYVVACASGFVTTGGPITVNFVSNGSIVRVGIGNTAVANTSTDFTLAKPIPSNKWVHCYLVLSGTSLSLYLNGTFIHTNTNAAAHGCPSGTWTLYNSSSGMNVAQRSLRLFSRAITAAEVNELYLTDKIADRSNLVGEWLMNEPWRTGANNIQDTSGNGLHTTTTNPLLLDSPYTVMRRKRKGKQLRLDNTKHAYTAQTFGLTSSTISAWVKWMGYKDGAATGAFVGQHTNGLMVRINPDGSVQVFKSSTASMLTTAGGVIPSGTWTHIATNYDGTTVNIYVNGKLVKTGTSVQTLSTLALGVGARANGAEFLRGTLDAVRIYTRALSADEHYALYLDQAPRDGLVAEYLFEQADIDQSKCVDTSGNDYHATWSGITLANYVSEL